MTFRPIYMLLGSVGLMGFSLMGQVGKAPKPIDGAKIFEQQCAPCHGDKGQGGKGFSKPLVGNRSLAELTKFISQSMPPGPKKCPAPDAAKVAAYIYKTFYSPLAQERNRPARVTLSRLTVRQFRNAVADLVGGSRPVVPAEAGRGLRGEYFKARDLQAKDRVIDRVDPEVKFDFGTDGPEPGKFDPRYFSTVWQGSVLAPDTGEYEFVVRSDQAVRLWVNGYKEPLIDAFVRSKTDVEFKASITLLGGRAYPIRLEFSKATQGVDEPEKQKAKPVQRASVSLLWTRPKHATETIPSRCLFPELSPETYVVTTPFPADDRSIGYERGNSVSKEWDDATTAAALETAAYVASHLTNLSGIQETDPKRKERLIGFCHDFVERAFRRPLSPEIEATYITKQFAATPDLEMAVKRVVLLALQSPRFLYREIGAGKTDSYLTASQLAFELWDTLPDPELRRAAEHNELTTPEQLEKQTERMANDPRAWTKLRDFLMLWLKVDEVPDIVKSAKRFPGFDATTASDLRTSLELFLENKARSKESDYRELMLSRTEFLNGSLAKWYGANLPPDAPFQPVEVDQRSGVITQPYLLARFAYLDNSSPIHRGVLIVRNLLGRTLNPPPSAFAPLAPSLHPDLTTRQRVALQTKPAMCNTCHGIINPLGFTLEKFDAIGRLRDAENGKPIDATGSYLSRSGTVVKFSGADELAKYLATSDEAHSAFVEKLFVHLVKQPPLAYGPKTLPKLQSEFAENQYSIRKLMVRIAVATALDGGRNR
ncbi:hypothetical protein OP10G_2298 [Fimbriimonas ginsengisoli Gsoil 348]|uniref:PA14 domain protein n=2 Tax=Fimbriimonas ginsengisoli TaxID=1005039 RepID=A0A068NQG9_FIMGI|nr:hypothetical protein OP10G_2298 [Fimbriimonas ginsengisoli Gsoil 348]